MSLSYRGDLIIIAPTRYYVNNFFHFFEFFQFFENPLNTAFLSIINTDFDSYWTIFIYKMLLIKSFFLIFLATIPTIVQNPFSYRYKNTGFQLLVLTSNSENQYINNILLINNTNVDT